jgi:nitrous oxide reductase accessory protein NosL
MKTEVENRDIASWFIDDYVLHERTNPNQHQWLRGDTATLVIAGR